MTKEQIEAIPRVEARQLLARIPGGPGYDDRVLLAVEQAMNLEWWRGYHAAQASPMDDISPEEYYERYVTRGELQGVTFNAGVSEAKIRCKSCGRDEIIEGLPHGNCPNCSAPRVDGPAWGFDIVTAAPPRS